MKLLGQRAQFVPHTLCSKNERGRHIDWGKPDPVIGIVDFVSKYGGWFAVKYYASGTVQHECFKFCDIGEDVTLIGHKKNS